MKVLIGLPNVKVILKHNIGFCCANNIGISALGQCDFILLLNPDARVEVPCLEGAVALLQASGNEKVGAVSVPLVRFDWANRKPMDVYDSLGITMRWYGRWIDKGGGDRLESEDVADVLPRKSKQHAVLSCCLDGLRSRTALCME